MSSAGTGSYKPPDRDVTAVEPESVRLAAVRPGLVDLRVRFTPYWRIAAGPGCVQHAPGDWTRLQTQPIR